MRQAVTTGACRACHYTLKRRGARLIVHGVSWQEANALAQSLLRQADAFVHPFDDSLLWRGHGKLVSGVVRTGRSQAGHPLSVQGFLVDDAFFHDQTNRFFAALEYRDVEHRVAL